MNYIAIIHKEGDSDYGVSFPDFPGCVTAGSTLDEAKDMATEALQGHIECMVETGEDIPAAAALEDIMKSEDFRDGVAFLVSVTGSDRQVRFNVSAKESQVEAIDRLAKQAGLTRSSYIVQAALRD